MAGGNPAWPEAILHDDRIVEISDALRFVGAAALMQDSRVSPFLLIPLAARKAANLVVSFTRTCA